MNNQELIQELKRTRFKTPYDKLDNIVMLLNLDNFDYNLLVDRYLRKIQRFLSTDHEISYPSLSETLDYDEMMNDLKDQLCYELKIHLTYSTPSITFTEQVEDILFNPNNLDEYTVDQLHSLVMAFIR